MFANVLYFLWQIEIPKPDKTAPGEGWGLYSIQDFWMANWYYITAVAVLALIVLIVAREKKKNRKRFEEETAEKEKSES